MTSSIRDTIKEQSRLARMRMGQDAPEMVDIPSLTEVRVAQVPLTEREAQQGVILSASLEVLDNAGGLQARNRACIESDVWNSLRDPSDPEAKVFDSIEDMNGDLLSSDIDYLADNLMLLMSYASPSIDGLSDADLEDLKKVFGETDWSALTGRRWAAVKLCCETLFPELLQAKLRGIGSTDSSTSRSASDEST